MAGPQRYHLLEGWAGDLAAHIDLVADPGFLGHVARLRTGFKQVAFAVLAAQGWSDLPVNFDANGPRYACEAVLKEIAQAIRTQSPRRLLEAAYGGCPDGFLGALAKIGPTVQPKQFYAKLHDLFVDPDKRQIAMVARQFRRMDADKLGILAGLDPLFLVPRFAEKVSSTQEAVDLTAVLAVIRKACSGATGDALDASIRHHAGSISEWVKRWLSAADRIPFPPHDLGHEFVALDTAAKLADAARRYENCLRSSAMLVRVLRDMTRFWECPRLKVIVEAQAVGPATGWAYAAIHMPRNGFPSFEIAGEIENHFLGVGFGSLNWEPRAPSWDALNRLTRHSTMLREIEEIDEALDELVNEAAAAA